MFSLLPVFSSLHQPSASTSYRELLLEFLLLCYLGFMVRIPRCQRPQGPAHVSVDHLETIHIAGIDPTEPITRFVSWYYLRKDSLGV